MILPFNKAAVYPFYVTLFALLDYIEEKNKKEKSPREKDSYVHNLIFSETNENLTNPEGW